MEAVEKYYNERKVTAKPKTLKRTCDSGADIIPGPAKKRGRPVGSKNKAVKVVATIADHRTSPTPDPSSDVPTAGPSGMCVWRRRKI